VLVGCCESVCASVRWWTVFVACVDVSVWVPVGSRELGYVRLFSWSVATECPCECIADFPVILLYGDDIRSNSSLL